MYFTIYQVTNLVNNKIYIGKHQTTNLDDGYFGSGAALKKALKKYGKESFKKEILCIFDNDTSMNEKEKELITEEFVSRSDTYNMGVGGEGGPHFKGKKHSAETKQLISINSTGKLHTIESRAKISEANRRRIVKQETKDKISQKATGRRHTEETKQKIRDYNLRG